MSNNKDKVLPEVEDDEPDDWDKRIFSTGCAIEQDKLNDCFFNKKDWRKCQKQVSRRVALLPPSFSP
jgi:cytochrome c oxidase assembly factor 4